MGPIELFPDKQTLAHYAAKQAVTTLQAAIATHGSAIWVLAGGTTPELAYHIIADMYLDALDWSKVTFTIGDERIAPLDSADSNWHAIDQIFLSKLHGATFLRPVSDQSAEAAASDYRQKLSHFDHFDLVWLGVGEDGHTLSLFPGHPSLTPTTDTVIAVHDSPKPPTDRISLSINALTNTQSTFILAAGDSKADAVHQAMQPDSQLPIAQAARLTHATWLIDQAAGRLLY